VRFTILTICFMSLISLPVVAGTYIDSFGDGNMDEWKIGGIGGNWEIIDGELILKSTNSSGTFGFTLGEQTWKNYILEVKMRITEMQHFAGFGLSAGLLLRYNRAANGAYNAGLGLNPQTGAKQAEIIVGRNNIYIHIEPGQFDWTLDKWYNLKVVAQDSQFKLYIDGNLVVDFVDALYATGEPGVAVTSTVTAHFDDFVITEDDIPDVVTSVYSRSKAAITWGQMKN